MAARMLRPGMYCSKPSSSPMLAWRSIQSSFRRQDPGCGGRGIHETAYMYAKSAKKRPSSAVVAPSPRSTTSKPAVPKQNPLRPTGTPKAAPNTTTSATAVQPTDTTTPRTRQSNQEVLPPVSRPTEAPMRYRSSYDDMLEALKRGLDIPETEENSRRLTAAIASTHEPMLLYRSPGQKQFTMVSYSATMFMFFAGFQNFTMYQPLATADSWSLWAVSITGNFAALLFAGYGVVLATAPWKMVKSITAISSQQVSNSRPQLMLRLEFVQIVPLIKFAPLELPVSSVLKMHSISDKVRYLRAAREQEVRRSSVGDGFFNRVRLLLQDFKKLFDRKHYFGYLRLRGGSGLKSGTWKMDLSEAKVAYNGKALDVLLAKELTPPKWRIMAGHTNTLKL
ncbi:hypothetical protein MBLNU457_1973t1 [Dothideomycetes sp. NU457]